MAVTGFRFVQTRSTALERSVRKLKARSGVELHRKAFLNAAGAHFIRCFRREVVVQNNCTMHASSVICQAT